MTAKKPQLTEAQLLKAMPDLLVASVDDHKTPMDFFFLVQHEIDLYDEGEDSDIRNARDRAACVKFMEFCRSAIKPEGRP